MSGHDPGPGWREVRPGTPDQYRNVGALVEYGADGKRNHVWVCEEPVPPLPTEPYTVIRAEWRKGGHTFLVLTPVGWQDIDGNALRPGAEADLAGSVTSFEVLAEPRPVTAKAVLERVNDVLDGETPWITLMTRLAREFGVTS